MMHLNNEVSVAVNNGRLITADEYNTGPLECVGCNQPMYFRRQHKRKLNNKECNVRCTFVHKNENICESYQHKAAKKIIASTLSSWKFIIEKCMSCETEKILQYTQYNGIEEASFHEFKLDVGVLHLKHIIGAVEIYHTHRVDEYKKQKLDSLIKWVEVDASDVIRAFQCKKYTIESLNKVYKKCKTCLQHDLDKIREEHEREMMSNEDLRTKKQLSEETKERAERSLMQHEEYRTEEYNKIMQLRKYSPMLTFGKYRGQCVSELCGGFSYFDTRNWWYLRYLAGYANSKFYQNRFPIPKRIKDAAQKTFRHSCILCKEQVWEDWKLLCTNCWINQKNSCLRCDKYVKGNYTFCWSCNNKIKH